MNLEGKLNRIGLKLLSNQPIMFYSILVQVNIIMLIDHCITTNKHSESLQLK